MIAKNYAVWNYVNFKVDIAFLKAVLDILNNVLMTLIFLCRIDVKLFLVRHHGDSYFDSMTMINKTNLGIRKKLNIILFCLYYDYVTKISKN